MELNDSKIRKYKARVEVVEGISANLMNCLDDFSPGNGGEDSKESETEVKPKQWTVRNLTYDELQKAAEKADAVFKIVSKNIPEKTGDALTDAMIEAFSILQKQDSEMSYETIRKRHVLQAGSVEPKISYSQSVLISERFANDFGLLVNKIASLTLSGGFSPGE